MDASGWLLVLSVAVVGVLHTAVPDHWLPITLLARQRGWSKWETARAALQAGVGHVLTTLLLGLAVWAAGAAFATHFGTWVDTAASAALVIFGGWIAIAAWREMRGGHTHGHGQSHGHGHGHSHGHGHHHDGIHGPEMQRVETGHGAGSLSIFEEGMPPRFRFTGPGIDWVRAETVRDDGAQQQFAFANRGTFWESLDEIPEPHGFDVVLTLGHGQHDHVVKLRFARHDHPHDQAHDHDDPLYAPLRGVIVMARHAHAHRHGGIVHVHRHDHTAETAHPVTAETEAAPPLHVHQHKTSARTALLLILGSSPMVEGIPAFLAASRYGIGLILVMALVFASATIVTYVALCVASAAGLQRVSLGPLERYGEVISGLFIAAVGVLFWI
jgi:hypothetical protein